MRTVLIGSAITALVVIAVSGACKKDDPPAQNPQAWQQAQPGYGPQPGTAQPGYPQQQPGYPPQQPYPQQQPGYPPQQPYPQQQPGYPPPQPTVATPPAATGTAGMNPSPQGVPCTSDAQCLTHRCNVAAGKCSWPCQGAGDCAAGMQCIAPICVPSVPTASPSAK